MRFISRIARCSEQYRADKLDGTDLSPCQYTYITHICRCPGISQDGLAKTIHVNKSNVARQLAALEVSGYVIRRPSYSDKRIIECYPTVKADDILPMIYDMLRSWDEYLTEGFTADERETVARLLGIMSERAADYVDRRDGEAGDSQK